MKALQSELAKKVLANSETTARVRRVLSSGRLHAAADGFALAQAPDTVDFNDHESGKHYTLTPRFVGKAR